jgi:hypothetical protein
MTHYFTLPDKATWDAFQWLPSECGQYAYGPDGQFAVIGYGWHEIDGVRTDLPEYWVDIPQAHTPPAELEQYRVYPTNAKRVFV